ncbi:hypothetical protein ACO0QE_002607 [Hanseniaspora vineae]
MSQPVFLQEFAEQLESLTFNSGPIISQLARSSEEHIEHAQQIVDLVETRIEKCLPKHKLYSFYVLDSICKNVGRPYTIFFQRNLPKLFKQTYLIVDNTTRQKLINVFKTWLNPNGNSGSISNSPFDDDEYESAIFDKEVLKNLENFLIKASAVHEKNLKKTNTINYQPPTIPSLLKEIDRLIIICTDKVNLLQQRLSTAMSSLDPSSMPVQQQQQLQQVQALIMEEINKTQPKVMVLQELKGEIMKGNITMDALVQVQQQLRANFQQEHQEMVNLNTPSPQSTPALLQQQQQQLHQQQPALLNQSPPQMGSIFGDAPAQPAQDLHDGALMTNIFGDIGTEQTSTNDDIVNKNNTMQPIVDFMSSDSNSILKDLEQLKSSKMQKLFAKLKESKLIQEPDHDHSILTIWDKFCKHIPLDNKSRLNSSIHNLPDIHLLQHIVKDLNSSKIDINYFINSPNFKLDSKQINENYKSCFPFIQLLYRYKPEKCSMCGKRFHTAPTAMNMMQPHSIFRDSIHDHLDWHFRINKKINLNKGRAGLASRAWFLNDEQWTDLNPALESSHAAFNAETDMTNSANIGESTSGKRPYPGFDGGSKDLANDNESSFILMNNVFDTETKNEDGVDYCEMANNIHKKHKNYKAMYVIIPDDLISQQVECQICKDTLQTTYDENIGQWVWANCLQDHERYCHATCYYESKK